MATVANVMGGPVALFHAPEGTAFPTALDTDADAILADSVWTGASFVKAPYTADGVKLTIDVSLLEKVVAECYGVIGAEIEKVRAMLAIEFAESDTAAQLLAFANGAVTTVAASSGQVGKREFYIDMATGTVTRRAMAFQGKSPQGFSDAWCFPLVAPYGGVTTNFVKGKIRSYSANFMVFEDPSASDAQNRLMQRHMLTAIPTS